MFLYRIVCNKDRTTDLSGMGAYLEGGRWNNQGVFALYTSENRSLALLEVLAHVDYDILPKNMYIITLQLNDNLIWTEINKENLPEDWKTLENLEMKQTGSKILSNNQKFGLKVPSVVMPQEFNFVLNPTYFQFQEKIKILHVEILEMDNRLHT